MRIKLLFDNKKGSSTLLEKHFDLIKDLVTRYPNAIWRKVRGNNGESGYELDIWYFLLVFVIYFIS